MLCLFYWGDPVSFNYDYFFCHITELTDDDLWELRDIAPRAAILTSMNLSDTDSASESDSDMSLPEPLPSMFDDRLRGLQPDTVKERCLE